MTRVLSGAVLVALVVLVVFLAPPLLFLAFVELFLILAFREYVMLARASALYLPVLPAGAAACLACAAFSTAAGVSAPGAPLDLVLMTAVVALGTLALISWSGGRDAVAGAAAGVFPTLYLGLPLGALAAIRESRGREALFLLMLTVMVSDTAQYYTGRLFGRRPLAPAISPKKTMEGACGGLVFGALFLTIAGRWWLPGVQPALRGLLGLTLVALGIAGDLFESMLKRSAGVKDSSSLIPGHGGVLDRIDALLFAAPIYYVVLKYL